MKKTKKIIPVVTALIITLTLAVSTGCGGTLGIIGCIGCISALSSIDEFDNEHGITMPEITIPHDSSNEEETTRDSKNEDKTDKPEKPSRSITIGDGSFVFEEYDPEEFFEGCEELTRLASGKDPDAVIDQYEMLYEELEYIDEDSSILYVAYSEDPTDEYLSDQYIEFDRITQDCYDRFLTAINEVCKGPCADSFSKYVGEEYFDAFADYEPMTDEQSELYNRETELVDEYYTAIEDADNTGIDDSQLVNIVGPIYLELVQIRTQIAESYGYDNYADYADENIYCRDFTSDDIKLFYESVKKFSAEYYDLLYNSSAYYMPFYLDADVSEQELLSDLRTYGSKISTLAADASRMLIDDKLYSIGDSDSRMEGAYTISMQKSGVPFIFEKTDGNYTDFPTLTHEFGHFTAHTLNMNPNILIYGYGSLELSEIHSNGLQALYSHYYDEIYGSSYVGTMEAYNVINLISNVVDGCFYDEFQREIYANPSITLDEINMLYKDLCREYGDNYSDADYWWIHVSHSFESPMYYFSYAASGIVALQIWLTSQTDMEKAIDIWEQIVKAGSYTYGYMELLNEVGVNDFTNSTSVLMSCEMAMNFVKDNSYGLSN